MAVVCVLAGGFTPAGSAQVREPAVAGAFYPAKAETLRRQVETYFSQVKIERATLPAGELVGMIAPHAGYPYSGKIAARCFKLLAGAEYDTVVLLGPNHTVWGFADVSVWAKGAYRTPLGDIPIDDELAAAIIKADPEKFVNYPKAHLREHSLEVELPFLLEMLGSFKLVPIVLGDTSLATCEKLARVILANSAEKRILIVASSDLSHDKPYAEAVVMDKQALADMVNLASAKLSREAAQGKVEMCGLGPVLTLMSYARQLGNCQGVLLEYKNSGDVVGDKSSRIVGYGAVAFYKEGGKMANPYSAEEKQAMLKQARSTIENYFQTGKPGSSTLTAAKFQEKRGVFVTLHKQGQLRGCIGYIEPIKPLAQAISDNALNAAVQDFRFSPVTVKELPEIDIEISVLTPPEEIAGPEEFITGKHGIIIRKGLRSAVFLPQVAPEQGWTREETLNHLSQKAGLAANEWQKPGMKFYVFTAEVFGEKEH